MNTKIKTILSGALIAAGMLLALPARAQDDGAADKKPRPERPEGGQRGDQLARLVEALGLTPDQVEKLKPIVAAEMKERQEIRKEAGPDADRAVLREKMQAIREKYRPQIAAILTAEQKEKFAKMQERRPGGPGGPGGGEGKKGKKGEGEGDGAGAPPPPPEM